MHDLDFAFYSDVGGRKNNEDSYLAKKLEQGYLFLVADGLGGHGEGEIASQSAVGAVKEYMNTHEPDLVQAILHANRVVLQEQTTRSSQMKTTVAAAYVTQETITVAHVGDSRVYAFANNKVLWQTTDHSASQLAVSVGEITPAQIRHHEDRNVLLRALGANDTLRVDSYTLPTQNCQGLLFCSDGFWEYVLEEEMETHLATATVADKWLYKLRALQLSRAPERCDNNTAIAVIL